MISTGHKKNLAQQRKRMGLTHEQVATMRFIYTRSSALRYAMAGIEECMMEKRGVAIRILPLGSEGVVQQAMYNIITRMGMIKDFRFDRGFILYTPADEVEDE